MTQSRIVRALLLLAIAILGTWFVTLQRRPDPNAERAFDLAAGEEFADAARVVFRTAGDSVVVERRGDEYWVTHPIEDRASDTRILQSIHTARTLTSERDLPDIDGRGFGLEPAYRTFSLESGHGARWTIALGDSSPVTSLTYARVVGNAHIFLLRTFAARRDFFPVLDDLRDPFVLPLTGPVIDSIEVVAADTRLLAHRISKESWISKDPEGVLLDALPINRALRHLRTPVIKTYIDGPLDPRMRLDPPRARWVIFHAGRADTVRVGNPTSEGAFCMPAGRRAVAVMSGDFYPDFVSGWPGLAQKKLISIPPDSLVTVGSATGPAYERLDRGWTAAGDTALVRSPELFRRELESLCALQWIRYPRPAVAPPVPTPSTLYLSSGARAETLWFAPGPTDSTWLARSTRLELWGEVSLSAVRTWISRFDTR